MSAIELQYAAPTIPSGPDGTLSIAQCSESILKLQRNTCRIATMLRDMDVRVTDGERERFIG